MAWQSTKTLVRRFKADPNSETDDFEVKSKQKLETRADRLEVVKRLSAMANSRGGTMLIGLRTEANGTVVEESFGATSEANRDLMELAFHNTRPPLDIFAEARFEKPFGRRLMRIDIRRIQRDLVEYKEGPKKWQPYRRVGSGTFPMKAREIFERGKDLAAHDLRSPDLLPGERFDDWKSQATTWKIPQGMARRMITESDGLSQPVFGEVSELTLFDKPAVVGLWARPSIRRPGDWKPFISAIRENLETRFNELCYSIMVEGRVLCGVGHEALLSDVANIEGVGKAIIAGPPRSRAPHDSRFLPLVSGYIPTHTGLFWFQAEYQGDGGFWYRWECGLLCNDVLFETERPRRFFKAIGEVPTMFEAETRPVGFTLHGHIRLTRPRNVPGTRDDGDFLFVEADNPFYGQSDEIKRRSESRLPDEILRHFCSVPRIMYQVAGGRVPEDRAFHLSRIEVVRRSLRYETLFINAMALARGPPQRLDRGERPVVAR